MQDASSGKLVDLFDKNWWNLIFDINHERFVLEEAVKGPTNPVMTACVDGTKAPKNWTLGASNQWKTTHIHHIIRISIPFHVAIDRHAFDIVRCIRLHPSLSLGRNRLRKWALWSISPSPFRSLFPREISIQLFVTISLQKLEALPFLPTFCNSDSKIPYRMDRFCNDSLQNVDSRENGIGPFSLSKLAPFLLSGFSSVDGTTFCNEIVTKKNVDRMRERSR